LIVEAMPSVGASLTAATVTETDEVAEIEP